MSIVKGSVSMTSRCFINYNRKKNSNFQPNLRPEQKPAISSLLDELEDEIDYPRGLLDHTVIDTQ